MTIKNLNRARIAPHVSALVDTFIPESVRQRNPQFVNFIKSYLEFLESAHGSGYIQNTLVNQRNIESQEEQFLRRIEKEIGLFVPREYAASPRVFYNKISELWRAKGSQESIKTFFRLFLNDPVEVRFPWDSVLKSSDGIWLIANKLRVSIIAGKPEDLLGKNIEQLQEFAQGRVERIEKRVYSNEIVYELVLVREELVGNFRVGNTIRTFDGLVIAEVYNSVVNLKITNGGSGYKLGDKIELKGLEGTTFTAFVNQIDENGKILSITISEFGAGTTPKHILNIGNLGRPFFLDEFVLKSIEDEQAALVADLYVEDKYVEDEYVANIGDTGAPPVLPVQDLTFDNNNITFDNDNITFDNNVQSLTTTESSFDNNNITFDNDNITFDNNN